MEPAQEGSLRLAGLICGVEGLGMKRLAAPSHRSKHKDGKRGASGFRAIGRRFVAVRDLAGSGLDRSRHAARGPPDGALKTQRFERQRNERLPESQADEQSDRPAETGIADVCHPLLRR